MASRKEQKERARADRVAHEETERRETARRRRLQIGAGVVALAIIGAIIAVIVVAGGGGGGGGGSSGGSLAYRHGSVPPDAEIDLQTSPPPWQPVDKQLQQRVQALGLPGFSETTFHLHAWLHVYDDGKPVQVPANVGIDQAAGFLSPLHTHDATGVIHMEADQEYDFTLGQFMDLWGVKFSARQLGSLKTKGPEQQLQVYLNGKRVTTPVDVVLPEHGNVVIGYGKPGSFPKQPKLDWPQGL